MLKDAHEALYKAGNGQPLTIKEWGQAMEGLADVVREEEALLKMAKEYAPDYPWTQNTIREAIYALGEGRRGLQAARMDWNRVLAILLEFSADGRLQTYEDRERFRKQAQEILKEFGR